MSKKLMIVAVFLSLLMHMSLFVDFVSNNDTKPEGKGSRDSKSTTSSTKIRLYMNEYNEGLGEGETKKECENFYYGIGLQHWVSEITAVAVNGPAYKVGIRVGDSLMNFVETNSYGDLDLNTKFKFVIKHKNKDESTTYHLKKTKICTEDVNEN